MDHLQDNLKKNIYRLHKEGSLPDYVGEYSQEDSSNEPSHIFADRVKREFPIHTKADTFLSAVYAKEASEEIPSDVKHRIDQAVEFWNINSDLKGGEE